MMNRLAEVIDAHAWDEPADLLHVDSVCDYLHTGERCGRPRSRVVLEPRRRMDQARYAVVMGAFVHPSRPLRVTLAPGDHRVERAGAGPTIVHPVRGDSTSATTLPS